MENENIYWLGLHLCKGLGPATFWRLVDHFGCAENIVNATADELKGVKGIRTKQLDRIIVKDSIALAGEEELRRMVDFGGEVIFPWDGNYSSALARISDPPPVLFALGDSGLLVDAGVAMVGSRASTSYGRRVAYTLARDLSASGVCVTSGLALGIDSEAHAGAVEHGGKTIAVLGCGLDVIYPRQNRKLYEVIRQEGLLVSEYPLGTGPEAFRFPARNRIISGLSSGVVVVEAAKKSGSLITAQLALDENREVFAVPGQIDSYKSEGTHWLLQQGAKLVQSVEDILAELSGLRKKRDSDCENDTRHDNEKMVDVNEKILLDALDVYPVSRENLIVKSGLKPERVSEWLLFLELEGKIELLPGDEVRKVS